MGIIKTIIKFITCSSTLDDEEEEDKPPELYLEVKEIPITKKRKEEDRRQLSIREENRLKSGDIIKSYTEVKYISNGQYAKVYKAKDMYNNWVALKRIHKDFEKMVKRECNMLYHINSGYVIKLLDVFRRGDYYYMVLPYYKTDLFDEICNKRMRSYTTIIKILLGVGKGIQDLHKMGYIHGDIKLENIMLDSCYKPIIIDLGLAKKIENIEMYRNRISGTPMYIAPEVIDYRVYSEKVDVWSLGVVMYVLMFGYDPFNYMNDHSRSSEMFKNIKLMNQKYPIESEFCKSHIIYQKMVNLNKRMLDKNYKKRILLNEVMDILQDIRKEIGVEKSKIIIQRDQTNHLKRFKTI